MRPTESAGGCTLPIAKGIVTTFSFSAVPFRLFEDAYACVQLCTRTRTAAYVSAVRVLVALVRLRLLRAPPSQIPTPCWALIVVGVAFLSYHVGYVLAYWMRVTDIFERSIAWAISPAFLLGCACRPRYRGLERVENNTFVRYICPGKIDSTRVYALAKPAVPSQLICNHTL